MSDKFKVEIEGVDTDISIILSDMLNELDDAVRTQKRSANKSDFSGVSGKLDEIDEFIMEFLSDSMKNGEVATRASINSAIQSIHAHVVDRLETLKAKSGEKEFEAAKKSFEDNKSNTVQRDLASMEEDMEQGKDVTSYEERYNEAKAKYDFAFELAKKLNDGDIKKPIEQDGIENAIKDWQKSKTDYEKENKKFDNLEPDKIKADIGKLYNMLYKETGVKDEDIKAQFKKVKDKILDLVNESVYINVNVTMDENDVNQIKGATDLKQQLFDAYTKLNSKKSKEYKDIQNKISEKKDKIADNYKKGKEGNILYKLVGDDINQFIPADKSIEEQTRAAQALEEWKESTGIKAYYGSSSREMIAWANEYKKQMDELNDRKEAKESVQAEPIEAPTRNVIEAPDYKKIENETSITEISMADLIPGGDKNVVFSARKTALGRRDDPNNKFEFNNKSINDEDKKELNYAIAEIYSQFKEEMDANKMKALIPQSEIKKGNRIAELFRKIIRKPTKQEESIKEAWMKKIESAIKTKLSNEIDSKKGVAKEDYEQKTKDEDERFAKAQDDYNKNQTDFDKRYKLYGKDLEEFDKKVREKIVDGKSKEDAYKETRKDMTEEYGNPFKNSNDDEPELGDD